MNQNSMCYWFPRVCDLAPVPKTIICRLDTVAVIYAARSLGFPCFVRTDLCSGKHDWKDSCFIPGEDSIPTHLEKVMESNVRWQMLGIQPQAFVVREFLQLETMFNAFSGEMPINCERRYFVSGEKVLCSHPYWPVSAFNNHPARMATGPDWESQLKALNHRGPDEEVLDSYASRIGKVIEGDWSIDFAKDKQGKWWMLDMALAANSYHFPHQTEVL